ncbi:hypothetical protein N7523_010314 [Penicillium sp. IBT 18751x]|nr:hypothetical protein N7523_010314 [Penicillium sp. IBT 18751x]
MGNGAKASMKRERNQKDAKAAKSQTKSRAEFTHTSLRNHCSLLEHASNKHKKGLADCFPGVSV